MANFDFFFVFLSVALLSFFLESVFFFVASVFFLVDSVCFLVEEESDECFLYPEAAPPWNAPLPVTRCPEAVSYTHLDVYKRQLHTVAIQ